MFTRASRLRISHCNPSEQARAHARGEGCWSHLASPLARSSWLLGLAGRCPSCSTCSCTLRPAGLGNDVDLIRKALAAAGVLNIHSTRRPRTSAVSLEGRAGLRACSSRRIAPAGLWAVACPRGKSALLPGLICSRRGASQCCKRGGRGARTHRARWERACAARGTVWVARLRGERRAFQPS